MSEQYAITIPDTGSLSQSGTIIERRAADLCIQTPDDYAASAAIQDDCKRHEDMVEGALGEIRDHAHKAHKAVTTLIGNLLRPFRTARTVVDAKRGVYRIEQERLRQIEEARLRAEAAKAEAERRKAEEDERLRLAAELEAAGEAETAAVLIDEAVNAAPLPPPPLPVVATIVPRQEGRSVAKSWGYRVVDEQKIQRRYLMLNDKAIGAAVRSLGPQCGIDGIEVFAKETERVRS